VGFIDTLRRFTPTILLTSYRNFKKGKIRKSLEKDQRQGKTITTDRLVEDLSRLNIHFGDTVMVHASMSRIGALENGPETVISALLKVIGSVGNIMMPSSPNGGLQLDYIRGLKEFSVNYSPSAMGAISESFRKMSGVIRSASPTEPVCAFGPDAQWLIEGHFGTLTPYGSDSPWARLADKKGKILYIGVTLDNAGTSLHVLEDAVEQFKYPVYYSEIFVVDVRDADGNLHKVKTKVHNPEFSARRKCDRLIPLFVQKGVVIFGKLGNATVMCFDAEKMRNVMIEEYRKNGVTMYTPLGEELND
jgi:aminoglycoside 3-N-acetyltransferase